ncbi:CAP domain containing protein [Asbolus verrucosus]|uniref:CAP domain containing protein n=1 Tax=Asbolus verrucosus TaxID=1661398 RepID=A0A482VTY4_ASBVE|nr:CAP domain containing protein [Asbolus verrucosus]
MEKILLLNFCLCLQMLVMAADFDPSKFNYCKAECTDYYDEVHEHTACTCNKLEGTRTQIFDDIVNFRTAMVEIHNKLRNKLASGEETDRGFPNAANMRVINYDLELEYIANCYAKVIYKGHDKCNRKHHAEYNSGQNIAGSSERREDIEFFIQRVHKWYNEIDNVLNPADFIKVFGLEGHAKPKKSVGHFSQVVWAETTRVGCARVWIPNNPEKKAYHSVLICNYAGDDGIGGNIQDGTIYKVGEACSQCPEGTSCNDKYTSLCGEIEPIPEREPYKKGSHPLHHKDEL